MPKSVSWRRDPLILERVREVERRHLRGESNVAIAAALRVVEATVRNDLERGQTLWREHVGADLDQLRAEAVAELEDIRRRSLAAAEFDELMERAVLLDIPFETRDCPGGVDHGDGTACLRPHTLRVMVARDDKGSAMFRGNKAAALAQARQAVMDKAKVLGIIIERQEVSGQSLVRQYIGVAPEDLK